MPFQGHQTALVVLGIGLASLNIETPSYHEIARTRFWIPDPQSISPTLNQVSSRAFWRPFYNKMLKKMPTKGILSYLADTNVRRSRVQWGWKSPPHSSSLWCKCSSPPSDTGWSGWWRILLDTGTPSGRPYPVDSSDRWHKPAGGGLHRLLGQDMQPRGRWRSCFEQEESLANV